MAYLLNAPAPCVHQMTASSYQRSGFGTAGHAPGSRLPSCSNVSPGRIFTGPPPSLLSGCSTLATTCSLFWYDPAPIGCGWFTRVKNLSTSQLVTLLPTSPDQDQRTIIRTLWKLGAGRWRSAICEKAATSDADSSPDLSASATTHNASGLTSSARSGSDAHVSNSARLVDAGSACTSCTSTHKSWSRNVSQEGIHLLEDLQHPRFMATATVWLSCAASVPVVAPTE
jgi:hypothetical protein